MTAVNSEFSINLSEYIYAPEAGVKPDTGEDLSDKMRVLLDESNSQNKGIYFPEGVYHFSQNISIKSNNTLKGSVNGTVFRGMSPSGDAVIFGDGVYENSVANLSIGNIIFDNIRVNFYGRKNNISISHNVFINTVTDPGTAQLICSTNAYHINGNVFMRGHGFAGVALNTYGNSAGLLIEQNFLGSISDIDAARPWLDPETQKMLATLQELREVGTMVFEDAQGDFVAGWYSTSLLKKGIFRKNFFKGSDNLYLFNRKTGRDDIKRDHNIYIKMYDQVEVVQNYFGGWPGNDSAFGQLKFRNARGLVFAGNYLQKISFNARPYDDVGVQWMIMQDTFIFNNYLDDGMISYWQNFTDSEEKAINVTNYLVFSNQFINRDASQTLITSPAKTLSPDQFRCAENVFADTGALVRVGNDFAEMPLETLQSMLPTYASQYINIQPLVPSV